MTKPESLLVEPWGGMVCKEEVRVVTDFSKVVQNCKCLCLVEVLLYVITGCGEVCSI